jgi:hypothetical protein
MISYKTVVGDIEGYEIIIEDILKEIGRWKQNILYLGWSYIQ